MESVKNVNGPASSSNIDDSLPDFSTFVDEQVGFSPYWQPKVGAWFYGKVIDKDDVTEAVDFVRYTFISGMKNLECHRGPAEGAETVNVSKGEHFSLSVYHAISPLLDVYLEMPEEERPFIRVDCVEKRPTKAKREVWTWRVRVSEEDKKRLADYRAKGMLGAKSAAE